MRKNELLTGADSRPRVHIVEHEGGWVWQALASRSRSPRFPSPGAALDSAVAYHGPHVVAFVGPIPGAPGEGME